jgi:2-polyprenyl-3-methyl-5-hydroxy-6-metoxy-1,4-benzoquinol methylase
MKEIEYELMYELENKHWFFRARKFILKNFIARYIKTNGNKVLDLGCGTGNMMDMLKSFGNVAGLDSSPVAIDFCEKRGLKKVHLNRENNSLPFGENSFDIVCAFDVLEHVENENGTLREVFRTIKNEGCFFITVPAFDFLWSAHDDSLGHKRRYVKKELVKKLESAGFKILKASYFNSLLFPLAVSFRILRKIAFKINLAHFAGGNKKDAKSEFSFALPGIVNELFCKIFSFESRLLDRFNLPIGLSLICVCEVKK